MSIGNGPSAYSAASSSSIAHHGVPAAESLARERRPEPADRGVEPIEGELIELRGPSGVQRADRAVAVVGSHGGGEESSDAGAATAALASELGRLPAVVPDDTNHP